MISDEELVSEIKKRLGITGDHHDSLLLAYANDTKEFMHSGGIPADIVDSEASVGVISRGVADLWNLGAGEGNFSGVFFQRVTQMALTTWGLVTDAQSGTATTLNALSIEEIDECLECLNDNPDASGSSDSSGSNTGDSSGVVYTPMTQEEIDACTECLKD